MPNDLHKKFRIRVIEVYGTEKGAITKAIVEAIRVWLKQKQPPQSRK